MSDSTDDTSAPAVQETWRPIPSLKGLYEASSLGRIRSVVRYGGKAGTTRYGGNILRQNQNNHGRMYFTPSIDNIVVTKQVAVMVCEAFHGPKPEGKDLVAHWDGDHLNNRPENLRWATFFENEEDKRRHGRHAAGERNPSAKLTKEQADAIKAEVGTYREIAAKYGVSLSLVGMIRKGQVWSDDGNAVRRRRRAAMFSIRHRTPMRGAYGSRSKVTASQVESIRARFASGETQTQIAHSLGLSHGHVHTIVRNKAWHKAEPNFNISGPCCACFGLLTSAPDAPKGDKTA